MIQIQKNEKKQKETAKNKAAPLAPPTPAAQAATPAAPAAQAAAPPAPAASPILTQPTPPKKEQLPPLPEAKKRGKKAKQLIEKQNAKKAKEAKANANANAKAKEAKNKEFAQKVMKAEILKALGENANLYERHIKDNKLNNLFNLRENPENLMREIVNSIEDENVKYKLMQPHEKMKLPTLIKIYNARSNNKKGEVRELIIPKLAATRSINKLISESLNIPDELVQAALISRIQSSKTSPGTSITNPELLRSLRLYVNNRNRKVNNTLKKLVNNLVPQDKLTTQQAFQKAFKVTRKPGGGVGKKRKGPQSSTKVLDAARTAQRKRVERQASKLEPGRAQMLMEGHRAKRRRRESNFAAKKARNQAKRRRMESNFEAKQSPTRATSARQDFLNELKKERQLTNEVSRTIGKSPYSTTPRFARNERTKPGKTYANAARTQPEPPAPTVEENFTITPNPRIPSTLAQQLRNQPRMFNVGTSSRPQTPRSRPGSAQSSLEPNNKGPPVSQQST